MTKYYKEMAEKIWKMIVKSDFDEEFDGFGLRADDRVYEIGNTVDNSHQLYADPQYTDDSCEELLYPYIEEGPYKGYYDAGELEGTCAVKIEVRGKRDEERIAAIEKALEEVRDYRGKHIYVIAGEQFESGNDIDEIIIEEAKVLGVIG